MLAAFFASKIGRYVLVAGAVLLVASLAALYIFNKGSESGRARYKEALDEAVGQLKKRVADVKKPRSEDETLDRLDNGTF